MPFIRDVSANYQTERVMHAVIHAWYMSGLISRSIYIAIADSGPRGPRYVGALLYYEEIKLKHGIFCISFLLIKNSLQQQIHFNGNIFGNKCCHSNEGSLYKQT